MFESSYIIRMNIQHYCELLKLDLTATQRFQVSRLLLEAEEMLPASEAAEANARTE